MRNEFIEKFIVDGLKRFNQAELNNLGEMTVNSFKQLMNITNLTSILIVHNAEFEIPIKYVLNYCIKHDIDVFVLRQTTKTYQLFHATQPDNLDLEYFQYTQQPCIGQKFGQYQRFDVLLLPVMAFDQQANCVDYDLDLNRALLTKLNRLVKVTCGYATCLQEYASLKQAASLFSLDYIITEFRLFVKPTQ